MQMEDGIVSEEELIEVLRQFDEKRVEELPEKTRNIFYAIMKIADERDRLNNIIDELEKDIKNLYTYGIKNNAEQRDYLLNRLEGLKELKEYNK